MENLTTASTGAILLAVFAHPLVRAVLGLLAANILVGIAASLYRRSFYLAVVGDWLLTRAVPFVIGAGSIQLVILAVGPDLLPGGVTSALASTVWLFVIAALLGHILDTLREMGLPVPASLGDKPKSESQATP